MLSVASGNAPDTGACPRCESPLTTKPGWTDLPDPVRRDRVELEANETVREGRLCSRGYIGKGTRYIAEIKASADPSWLHNATVRIGQDRSQGRGRALATVVPLEERPLTWHGRPVVIHLTGPAIIANEWGALSLDLEDVERELQWVSDGNLTLCPHPEWVRSELATSWYGHSNLLKVPDWAFAPGVSFVVDGLAADGWRQLRRCGIGRRCISGYGQLALAGWEPTNRPPFEITEQ